MTASIRLAFSLLVGLVAACDGPAYDLTCYDGSVFQDGKCVPGPANGACLMNEQCTKPEAALCDTSMKACVACTDDAHCAHLAGLGVCNGGTCVQCTKDNETACGTNVCDLSSRTCTDKAAGSAAACQSCVNDRQCMTDHKCIAMNYQGTMRTGGYCLKNSVGGCSQPFSIELTGRASLSGAPEGSYCGINESVATCEAVRGLVDNLECANGTDAECPPPGGICRAKVGTLANRCTYRCTDPTECKAAPVSGSSCGPPEGMSAADKYCGGK